MNTGRIRVAIDTGGTFTDLVLFETETGRMVFHKIASTPDDPGRSLVRGIQEVVEQARVGDGSTVEIELLVHGTTVATNTVLQRRGARAAMITTAGFRDVLHIQRQDRPHMYDLRSRRAEPLVPRSRRFELRERILYDGTVEIPLDTGQLHEVIAELKRQNVEAVAVGLLHSHLYAANEQAVGEALARELPEATVCLSHELVQEEGEYERFSTCAMNAFVQPVMASYLKRVEDGLSKAGFDAPLFVMKSNGGVMSAKAAARHSVHTILSGPAGGVVAGAAIAQGLEHGKNMITADMGGTSFDVAVIHEGQIEFARTAEMAGLAIKVPMLDIHTVGAGGGSIGWVDPGSSLRVGPHSAGADPGPACYGRGGDKPTVTDANLVLGRLSHATLLGGGMEVDVEASRRVIADELAGPLGLSIEAAAEGVIRVVVATMTAAIRKLTVERGYDPRTFTLCPFGGAGPLHGAEIAREMNLEQVLVPLAPGVTSAVGLLMSHLREDNVRTQVALLSESSPDQILGVIEELEAAARTRLAFAATEYGLQTTIQLGMRYLGQGFDLAVEIPAGRPDLESLCADFHSTHERMYGFSREDQPVELVNIWVSVEADLGAVRLPEVAAEGVVAEPVAQRPVVFEGRHVDTPVFRRGDLRAGSAVQGPAIVEQLDSTTVIWPGQAATVDRLGQLLLGAV